MILLIPPDLPLDEPSPAPAPAVPAARLPPPEELVAAATGAPRLLKAVSPCRIRFNLSSRIWDGTGWDGIGWGTRVSAGINYVSPTRS